MTPITALAGMPRQSRGNKARLRAGVVGGLRPRDSRDRALAEAFGMARDLSFQHVAREARHHGAAAGKQAEKKSENAAAHHRADRFNRFGAVGKQITQALAIVQHFAIIIAFRHEQDFADPEQSHGDHGDPETVAQRGDVENESLFAGDEIDADRAEQQAEPDHRKALFSGAFADTENQDKAEKQQSGLFDGSKQ
jgi:hypothetical protein